MKAITAVLPVFQEHANNPAMIHHAMLLIQQQTKYLNPGQTPVMTADQTLFTLWTGKGNSMIGARCVGWKLPVLMGDLHTEMTFMICLGMPETYYIHLFTTDMIKFDREWFWIYFSD